ncbi:CynX/NimT family MFS transporter [Paeniglutamicibacter sp. ORCA_105]|uniref:CynX/NimT family MFS transporter n=1 Tax=Paeniglutamicibacter sp. ORCA_105 TaxID=3377336 RepID=UPI003894BD84
MSGGITSPRNALELRPVWPGRALALAGIVLVALNLRSAVTAMSPIVGRIVVDVPMDDVALGVIGMLPPLMLATGGLLGPILARWIRLETNMVLACAGMCAGHLIRAMAGEFTQLLVGSVVAMLAMGVGNVLLPPLVKKYFPDRIALMTSIYAMLFSVSTAIPGTVAPLAADAAGWRGSLMVWGVAAAIAVPPWIVLAFRGRSRASKAGNGSPAALAGRGAGAGLWRSRVAWGLMLMHGLSALNGYAMLAWLPEILMDTAGISGIEAGVLLSIYAVTAGPLALVVPAIALRMRNPGVLAYIGASLFASGYTGLLLAPGVLTPLWVLVSASGTGLFPVMLALINARTRTLATTAALSGFVQGNGALISVAGPLVVGLLHDATGGWTAPFCFLIAASAGIVLGGILLRSPLSVDEELHEYASRR